MTDLERADALLYALLTEDDAPRQEAMLARALAAAYRRGAEAMRERAAQTCSLMEDRDNFDCAAAIRALSLRPEADERGGRGSAG